MPRYDYRCPANGRTIEVSHAMSESVRTWGEACKIAAVEPGNTPADSPVEKVIGLSFAHTSTAGGTPSRPCGPSCGCHPH
jgi:hypothetical protein